MNKVEDIFPRPTSWFYDSSSKWSEQDSKYHSALKNLTLGNQWGDKKKVHSVEQLEKKIIGDGWYVRRREAAIEAYYKWGMPNGV